MSIYEDYIAISRYARYLPDKKRRETWDETVDRYAIIFVDIIVPTLPLTTSECSVSPCIFK